MVLLLYPYFDDGMTKMVNFEVTIPMNSNLNLPQDREIAIGYWQ
jgi:hypothetical protein